MYTLLTPKQCKIFGATPGCLDVEISHNSQMGEEERDNTASIQTSPEATDVAWGSGERVGKTDIGGIPRNQDSTGRDSAVGIPRVGIPRSQDSAGPDSASQVSSAC